MIPDRYSKEEDRLGWLREAYQEGDSWLRSQKAMSQMRAAMDLLAGKEIEDIPAELSKAFHNRLKRQIREAVAVQSQINPSWYYETSNPQFEPVSEQVNQLLKSWWSSSFADLAIRKTVQYKVPLGTGYSSPRWSKPRGSFGDGEIVLDSFGPADVRLIQPPRDYDIQRSYAVITTVEMPINMARAMYPAKAARIIPDRDTPTFGDSQAKRWMERMTRGFGSLAYRMFGVKKTKKDLETRFPTVDVHYMYVNDEAINDSQTVVSMGQPGSTWHYQVPYFGQDIPDGLPDPATGRQTMRPAKLEDIRLYPLRRLVIFTNTALLYDDTSIYWHGRVPLVRFRSDDWPWEALGYGMILDGAPLQRELNNVLRGLGDRVNVSLRPGLLFDENSISAREMEKVDPRKPGARIRLNLAGALNPISTLLPPELLRIDSSWVEYIRVIAEFMDHQSAVTDFRNLAKAKQIPSDATIDKILEISGPLVQDETRTMEKAMAELGEMILPMLFQFYSQKRKFSIIANDKIGVSFFDFDPKNLVPNEMQPVLSRIPETQKWRVMQEFQHAFRMVVLPNSLHEATQTQQKLLMLQLWRDGRFPLDPVTLAQTLGIRNFGDPWPEVTSVYDRYKHYLKDMTEFQAILGVLATMVQMRAGLGAMAGGAGGMEQGGAPGEQPKAFQNGEERGRPPSGQKMPQIKSKDGGARTTVAES